MAKTNFQSIDEYIAACPEQSQSYMQKIRELIKTLAPEAKEKISYQIACLELNGKNLVHFAGWKQHVSMYPTPTGTEAFNKAIAKYAGGKGTTKFPLDEPLPLKLIGQIVKFRVADNLKNEKLKAGKEK
ncbi:MAG: DUF1801 domain-containing protein [Anaerolineales bacterium]|nr:DUF1801 domain-containing protein [Anaerolineales bacterium]